MIDAAVLLREIFDDLAKDRRLSGYHLAVHCNQEGSRDHISVGHPFGWDDLGRWRKTLKIVYAGGDLVLTDLDGRLDTLRPSPTDRWEVFELADPNVWDALPSRISSILEEHNRS